MQDKLKTTDLVSAVVQSNDSFESNANIEGRYTYTNMGPVEEQRDEYVALRSHITAVKKSLVLKVDLAQNKLNNALAKSFMQRLLTLDVIKGLRDEVAVAKLFDSSLLINLQSELAAIPTEIKWEEANCNLITTVGKNNILDNHFTGSAYTAAWFTGLIDNASFTALAAADTMAAHAGWIEFVGYSNGTRIAPSWTTASAGSKAYSTPVSFAITAAATLNGAFINSVSTKSGTTGVLCSEGSFAATRIVANGDTLNVSYTSTLT